MRKIVMFNRVTINGFFGGQNGEIDWFVPDREVDEAIHGMMRPDTVLFGRETYQMFESFWPHVASNPNASPGERAMADELSVMTKVVFSKSLKEVTWENTELVNGDLVDEVRKRKKGDGPDIVIFGSGTIVQQLAADNLIDEYLIVITPVVLGSGKPLFRDVKTFKPSLVATKSFPSGNVLLHYLAGTNDR